MHVRSAERTERAPFVACARAVHVVPAQGFPPGALLPLAAVPSIRSIRPLGLIVLAAVVLQACGGPTQVATRHATARPKPALKSVAATTLGTLPAAVQDAAVAPLGEGRLALLGGIDSAQTSTDAIVTLGAGGATPDPGTLPVPQHDAQAAKLGADVYVFGGGQVASYDHIVRYDPASGTTATVGSLPTPASDVAVTSIGDTAYIVGGYTGAGWLDTILAWRPGSTARVVGHLPVGLRYAAVAVAGRRIIIAGGTEPSSVSDQILSFDPASGVVSPLGRLPSPVTHASAVFLDGRVVLVGGRAQADGGQTAAVLAINPATGAVTTVGRLPQPLSDAAVALDGGRIIVAGGDDGNGPQSSILALIPR